MAYEDALATLQSRLDAFGVKAHTPLLCELDAEMKTVRDAEAIAKEILGY